MQIFPIPDIYSILERKKDDYEIGFYIGRYVFEICCKNS